MLYMIRAGERGPLKIGVTEDIERRVCSIQTGNHEKLRVEVLVPETFWVDEKHIHNMLRAERLSGEWFSGRKTDALLANLKRYQETGNLPPPSKMYTPPHDDEDCQYPVGVVSLKVA